MVAPSNDRLNYETHTCALKQKTKEGVAFNFAPRISTQADRAMKTEQGAMNYLLW